MLIMPNIITSNMNLHKLLPNNNYCLHVNNINSLYTSESKVIYKQSYKKIYDSITYLFWLIYEIAGNVHLHLDICRYLVGQILHQYLNGKWIGGRIDWIFDDLDAFNDHDLRSCIIENFSFEGQALKNRYRRMHIHTQINNINFQNSRLINILFVNFNFREIIFSHSKMFNCSFEDKINTNVYIRYTLFIQSVIEDSTFKYCIITNCNFDQATCNNSSFIGSNFESCDLSNTKFLYCNLLKTSFYRNKMVGCVFYECNLFDDYFRYQYNIINFVFKQCNLFFVKFSGCNMINCGFFKCNLSFSTFNKNDLTYCIFNECDLFNGNNKCSKKYNMFYQCDMSFVNFLRCNLSNTKFIECKFLIMNFTYCIFSVDNIYNLLTYELSTTKFINCKFPEIPFNNTKFIDCKIYPVQNKCHQKMIYIYWMIYCKTINISHAQYNNFIIKYLNRKLDNNMYTYIYDWIHILRYKSISDLDSVLDSNLDLDSNSNLDLDLDSNAEKIFTDYFNRRSIFVLKKFEKSFLQIRYLSMNANYLLKSSLMINNKHSVLRMVQNEIYKAMVDKIERNIFPIDDLQTVVGNCNGTIFIRYQMSKIQYLKTDSDVSDVSDVSDMSPVIIDNFYYNKYKFNLGLYLLVVDLKIHKSWLHSNK